MVEFSACNTITGKTVELTVAQITIINTLHEESEPQKVTPEKAHCLCCISGKKQCVRKRCTRNRDDSSSLKTVRKSPFKNAGGLHKKWTDVAVSASGATISGCL